MYRERLLTSLSSTPRPSSQASLTSAASASGSVVEGFEKKVLKVMELFEILAADGTAYAEELKRLLGVVAKPSIASPVGSPQSGRSTGRSHMVLEGVVEHTLAYLDTCEARQPYILTPVLTFTSKLPRRIKSSSWRNS